MKNFERLYSEIESEHKDTLKALKRRAYITKHFRNLINILILLTAFIVLYSIFRSGLVLVYFTIFLGIFLVVKASSSGKLMNKIVKPNEDIYINFYIEHIADKFINEFYGLNFIVDEYIFEDVVLNEITRFDTANQRYKISGLLFEKEAEMSVLFAGKYIGPTRGDDPVSHIFSTLIFCTIKAEDRFQNIDLNITSKTDNIYNKFKSHYTNDDFYQHFKPEDLHNTFISHTLKEELINIKKGVDKQFSVIIRNSNFHLCIHNCEGMYFDLKNEKECLKNYCDCIDFIIRIYALFKENI